jgi:hypothetical protein
MKPIRTTAPETSLLNPKFRYTPAAKTDVRRTFARIRREQAERQQQQEKRA